MSAYLANLTFAVASMHGCDCVHSGTSRVVEFWEGSKVFDGEIETFTLSGHPKASEAFAWGFADDAGAIQYIAVLNVPPINDPSDAVRAAIASGQLPPV